VLDAELGDLQILQEIELEYLERRGDVDAGVRIRDEVHHLIG
jgi:hypothetical protein